MNGETKALHDFRRSVLVALGFAAVGAVIAYIIGVNPVWGAIVSSATVLIFLPAIDMYGSRQSLTKV